MNILYLDEKKKRAVTKALSRHGRVFHAADIGDALPLLLENDFDYYFVDADTSQAQSFLKHLEHDPQLATPRAVVLLTNNEDEDCSAWRVDTFINHGRIGQDVPYVFSHLRGEAAEPTKVLTIVPGDSAGGEDARGRLRAFEGHPTDDRAGERVRPPDPRRDAHHMDLEDAEGVACSRGEEATRGRERPERKGPVTVGGRYRAGRFILLAAVSLVLALGVWGFVRGPLGADSAREHQGFEGMETVEAESPPVDARLAVPGSGKPEEAPGEEEAFVEGEATGVRDGITVDSAGVDGQAPVEKSVAPAESPSPAPAPVASENHAPVVTINGPSTVNQGQTVTYTASGSDPDGDPVTLSWTSRTVQFNTTDTVTITVTATDSRGVSSTASKTIQVI